MLNRVILMGRLVADPELRKTQGGTSVAAARIAVDRDFKDAGGDRQADFIDIVAWRGTAEMLCKYFTKGRMLALEGRLQIRPWTDKDGRKRTAAEVVADSIWFADSKKTSEPSAGGQDFREIPEDEEGELPL